MKKRFNKIFNLIMSIIYCLCYSALAFADGEDIAKVPMANAFATFLGTGLDALLLLEVGSAIYLFSAGERKVKIFVGIFIIILITAFVRTKFGG